MNEFHFNQLTPEQQSLVDEAERAMGFAFTNSRSCWGAAVETAGGEIFVGANMFISATGMVTCAEVAALSAANVSGQRNIRRMAVITRQVTGEVVEPATSCGRCRQILFEFSQISQLDIELIYSNTRKDQILVTSIGELLPTPYNSGILGSLEGATTLSE